MKMADYFSDADQSGYSGAVDQKLMQNSTLLNATANNSIMNTSGGPKDMGPTMIMTRSIGPHVGSGSTSGNTTFYQGTSVHRPYGHTMSEDRARELEAVLLANVDINCPPGTATT